jgi:hypothetical protein
LRDNTCYLTIHRPKKLTRKINTLIELLLSFFLFQVSIASPLFKLDASESATANNIYLLNIRTEPAIVNNGESFKLNATVVNNSSSTIIFENGCGISPLFAEFDRNVNISSRNTITCQAIITDSLKSGQNISLVGPSADKVYVASGLGLTKSKVTFEYQTEFANNNPPIANTSKQYIFNIY